MQAETFPAEEEGGTPRFYNDLSFEERTKLLKDRLKKYCQKVRISGVEGMAVRPLAVDTAQLCTCLTTAMDRLMEEKRQAGVSQRKKHFDVGAMRA